MNIFLSYFQISLSHFLFGRCNARIENFLVFVNKYVTITCNRIIIIIIMNNVEFICLNRLFITP
jgi:hypothetical protein